MLLLLPASTLLLLLLLLHLSVHSFISPFLILSISISLSRFHFLFRMFRCSFLSFFFFLGFLFRSFVSIRVWFFFSFFFFFFSSVTLHYVALCCFFLFYFFFFFLCFSLSFFQFRRDPPLWLALMLSLVNFKLGSFRFNEFVYRDWEGGGEEVMVLFFFSSSSSSSFFFFFVFLLFFVYWVRLEIDMKVNRFQFYTVFFFVQSSGSTRENDSFFHRRLGRFPVADTAEGPRIIQISQLDF